MNENEPIYNPDRGIINVGSCYKILGKIGGKSKAKDEITSSERAVK
jgi:hypothetical protein